MPKQIVIEPIASKDSEVFSKAMEWYRQLIALTFGVPIDELFGQKWISPKKKK